MFDLNMIWKIFNSSVLINIAGKLFDHIIGKHKRRIQTKEKTLKIRQENLENSCRILLSAILSFPNETPNDIMQETFCPVYGLENFDGVINSLDIQISDYAERLSVHNFEYGKKYQIESAINNRKYYKKRIIEIKGKYYFAKGKYKKIFSNAKGTFEMYAGQSVKNSLVAFETTLHNAFVSGGCLWDGDMKINAIENVRDELIRQIRQDIGTDL